MVIKQGVFRLTDLDRLGTRCTLFPTFDTYYLPEGKKRMVRRIRNFRIEQSFAIEFETYHEGKEEKQREKTPVPLKSIYPEIKNVYNHTGQLIACRVIKEQPIYRVAKRKPKEPMKEFDNQYWLKDSL